MCVEKKQGEEFGGEEVCGMRVPLRADDTKAGDHGSVCSTKGVWH